MSCKIGLARPYLNIQNFPKPFYSKIPSTTIPIKSDYIRIERFSTKHAVVWLKRIKSDYIRIESPPMHVFPLPPEKDKIRLY